VLFSKTTLPRLRRLEPHHPGDAPSRAQVTAASVIARRLLAAHLLGAHLLKPLGGAIAEIGMALIQQALSDGAVPLQALGLEIRAVVTPHLRPLVPVQTQPAQAIQNRPHGPLDLPGDIGILDAHNEPAAMVAGKEPVEQGGADIAHVGQTRGAGGIAHSDGLAHICVSFIASSSF
jgi:hypothetical protein